MKILLVAATPFEIAPTIAWLENDFAQRSTGVFVKENIEISLCVTGIGMLATAWHLAHVFAKNKPDFAINAGIAGALDPKLQLGEVLYIKEETFADLGVEDKEGQLIDLFELGFSDANAFPFTAGKLLNPSSSAANYLPTATGITLNKANGSAASIAQCRKKYPDAQVESMEGAAFFFACLHSGIAFSEIRAITNYVEPRNREAWNLAGAIENLNSTLGDILRMVV